MYRLGNLSHFLVSGVYPINVYHYFTNTYSTSVLLIKKKKEKCRLS